MALHPMLAALRRHKTGVILIALQIGLTLAVVCNALFIIGQRLERIRRPTGVDGQNLFLISQQWANAPTSDDAGAVDKLDAWMREDVTTLRGLADVASAAPTNAVPLMGPVWSSRVGVSPGVKADQLKGVAAASYYFSNEQLLRVLGLKLIAGRAFTAADVTQRSFRDTTRKPAVVVISKALADTLFPDGNALGKPVYLNDESESSTVVGIVQRLQTSSAFRWTDPFTYNTVLWPMRMDAPFSRYVVRAKPGRLQAAMQEARAALYKANPLRVIDDETGIRTFAEIRADAYHADRGMAIVMGLICLVLLAVTAAGIVGLTSFWVGQRRKQIGVRRALGARRRDILRYFHAENLLIVGAGALLGIVLAVGLNLWLITHYELQRLPVAYVLAGALVVLGLGQAAVIAPARRGASVPPVVATRSV